MDIKKQIKQNLQEAEVYRSQGLLTEATEKYKRTENLIRESKNLKNKQNLLASITKKIRTLDQHTADEGKKPLLPAISPKAQDLIKKLFSISEAGEKDKDTTALDGAVVLAKFGQYERALIELNELLREDSLRVVAAKNILRCKMAISSTDDVVAQFQEWQSSRLFLPEQLETVYIFMNTLLDRKKKADRVLPEELESPDFTQNGLPQEGLHQEELQQEEFSDQETRQAIVSDQPGRDQESETTETTEEEILDISAIAITFKSGPIKGRPIELDVSFQSGNTISLIIPRQEQALIDNLKVGGKLDDVQFYSPIAIFKGSGVVTSSTKIKTGPKQGDYCLDIKVVSN